MDDDRLKEIHKEAREREQQIKSGDNNPISLANVNGRFVAHDEAPSKEVSHDGVITIKQITEPRDVVVIVNRLSDIFGSVTGIGRIDDGIYRFLYRRY